MCECECVSVIVCVCVYVCVCVCVCKYVYVLCTVGVSNASKRFLQVQLHKLQLRTTNYKQVKLDTHTHILSYQLLRLFLSVPTHRQTGDSAGHANWARPLSIKTLSITTLSITTLSITTLSITTLSITTLSSTKKCDICSVKLNVVSAVSFLLSFANEPFILSVILLNVAVLNVVAPW
jgi:hypothetical protein